MRMKFLLDTNIISESIKLQPNQIFLAQFRQNLPESAVSEAMPLGLSHQWHGMSFFTVFIACPSRDEKDFCLIT